MAERTTTGTYACARAATRPSVEGDLDPAAWAGVARTPRFGDVATGALSLFDTRAALQWDDEALYVGLTMEESDVWCTGEERRGLIWQENAVELLVAGEGAYYDLWINPAGVAHEMLFVWKDAYTRGGRYDVPELDLATHRPMVFGGDAGPAHPRGMRWGFFHWQLPGLRVGVRVDGTLDRRDDVDRGWTVEIALPWAGMQHLADGSLPPGPGDVWRVALARCEVIDQRRSRWAALWTPWPTGSDGPLMPDHCIDVHLEG